MRYRPTQRSGALASGPTPRPALRRAIRFASDVHSYSEACLVAIPSAPSGLCASPSAGGRLHDKKPRSEVNPAGAFWMVLAL